MLSQFLINGLITGSVYALLALGFAIVYNTTKIFHIAYAALYVLAPYVFLTFYSTWGFPLIISFTISIGITLLVSLFIEYFIYKPLSEKKSSNEVILISSLGVMIVVVNFIGMIYGNETKVILLEISNSLHFGNVIITYNQILQIGVTIFFIFLFFIYLKFSKFGKRTRALRDDVELFSVMGYNAYKMRAELFMLSGIFVAIGANLVALDVGMDPYVGMPMVVNAIVALIIGGVGRFEAPVLGGFLIGILQALTVWVFSARWQDVIIFIVLILFLVFRPQGILGEKNRAV